MLDDDEVSEVAKATEEEKEVYGGCGRVNDSADIGVVGALAAADEGDADGLTVAGCVKVGGTGLRVVYTIPAVLCCVTWKLGSCGCGEMGFFVGFDGFEGRIAVGFSQLGGRGLVIKFGSVVMCQWCCVTAVSCGDVFQ